VAPKERMDAVNEKTINQTDQDPLNYEASDDAVEAAAGNEAWPAITIFCTGIGCPV
jgi:hypothetical protein